VDVTASELSDLIGFLTGPLNETFNLKTYNCTNSTVLISVATFLTVWGLSCHKTSLSGLLDLVLHLEG
jgi:hypothetical protein